MIGAAVLADPYFSDKTFFFGAFERLSSTAIRLGQLQSRRPTFDREISPASRPRLPILQQAILLLATSSLLARINSVSKIILDKYIPAPNHSQQSDIVTRIASSTISNQFDARLDHVFGSRHNVFGRYSYKNWDRLSPTALSGFRPTSRGSTDPHDGDLR